MAERDQRIACTLAVPSRAALASVHPTGLDA
jgi:hypothetical protein